MMHYGLGGCDSGGAFSPDDIEKAIPKPFLIQMMGDVATALNMFPNSETVLIFVKQPTPLLVGAALEKFIVPYRISRTNEQN